MGKFLSAPNFVNSETNSQKSDNQSGLIKSLSLGCVSHLSASGIVYFSDLNFYVIVDNRRQVMSRMAGGRSREHDTGGRSQMLHHRVITLHLSRLIFISYFLFRFCF